MKVFQDKGKTLLPRVDSILLLSRLLAVLGVVAILFVEDFSYGDRLLLSILSGTFLLQLFLG